MSGPLIRGRVAPAPTAFAAALANKAALLARYHARIHTRIAKWKADYAAR